MHILTALPLLLILTTPTSAFDLSPFLHALDITTYFTAPNNTSPDSHQPKDLLKRQQSSNSCPANFNACSNLGAPNLCCAPSALCSADARGQVACCPTGYACSGTIGGVLTAGTVDGMGRVIGGAATATGGGVMASTTATLGGAGVITTSNGNGGMGGASSMATGNGFIIDGGQTVAVPGSSGGQRRVEVPFVARVVIWVLEVLPLI